jgi:hypothetical protein
MFTTITKCRSCEAVGLRPFFDLGEQPPANSLIKSPTEDEEVYPLSLSWCPQCNLVQLNETLDPKALFSRYVWVTGTSKTANSFAVTFCNELLNRAGNKADGYVLEIASNDGTFLKPFIDQGVKVLGVDPAENIAKVANDAGIPTQAVFFGDEAARAIVAERGSAHMVFARNVLPHVANTHDFVKGLATALSDDGTLAIEAHYAGIILDELHYDSIYHEHLCYFTLKSLENLLNSHGLYVFDFMKSPISGGSMILYAKKKQLAPSDALTLFRQKELASKTNDFDSWESFAKRSRVHKEMIMKILNDAKAAGKRVAGWGASARSSTMLNFCKIDESHIFGIVDLNPLKQGLYTAGTHIPIRPPQEIMAGNPDCVFILAWNFAEEIVDDLAKKWSYKGEVVIPLPGDPRRMNLSRSSQ